MKKLLLIPFLLLSIAGYSQMNTFGGIGLRVNDTTTYQTNAADFHTAGYYDIYFNNQATNDHWDIWNGSSYDHIFAFGQGSGGAWGSITGTLSAQTDLQTALNLKAPLASPTFTGDPLAPTPTAADNDTSIPTTAWVKANSPKILIIDIGDETTVVVSGTGVRTFRMPYAMTVTEVRASLKTAQSSGSIFTVDINESGATILSVKLTIDNTEKTSLTAVTAPVISDTALANDAEITFDIDLAGAAGVGPKIVLIGY